MAPRTLRLRYPTTCAVCGVELQRGTDAVWDGEAKTATCLRCTGAATAPTTEVPAAGGTSAQREHDRRSSKRETRVRTAHPRIGGLILALSDDPASTKAWARGAEGERKVARHLNKLTDDGIVILHDRRIPGSKANIDHVAIGPTGVTIIDTKRYKGRLELRRTGSLFRPGPDKLFVGGRDRTKLIAGMGCQVAAVGAALGELAADVPIAAALCFIDFDVKVADVFQKPFTIDSVQVTWVRALTKRLREPGPLSDDQVAAVAERLSTALPPA